MTSAPTPSNTCQFCGRKLQFEHRELLGKTITIPILCDCEESVKHREEQEELKRKHEAYLEETKAQSAMRRAGFPKRYLGVTPIGDKNELLKSGDGLYITGNVGAGKTYYACQVAKGFYLDNKKHMRFASSTTLMTSLRPSDMSEIDVVDSFVNTPLLVLDDLGKDAPSDWVLSKLFQVIDGRYSAMNPTIITTQYPSRQLAERLSERGNVETAQAIISRLYDTCKGMHIEGGDRRLHG